MLRRQPRFDLPGDPAAAAGPVEATLVTDVSQIAPGDSFTVALRLQHAPHWHTYYVNPGQVGNPPEVEWTLPDGVKAGPLRFPVPKVGDFAGAKFYGYEGDAWFLSTITTPSVLPEVVEITAKVSWLACKEQCIPGDATIVLEIDSGAETTPYEDVATAFAQARSRIPIPQDMAPWTISVSENKDRIAIDLIPALGAVDEPSGVHFFSSDRQDDAQEPQKLAPLPNGGWRLEIKRALKDTFDEPIEKLPYLSGILSAGSGWLADDPAVKGIALDELPITDEPGGGRTTASGGSGLPLPAILGLMLLGGLILNLMPCVFPVIGLKIMSFVQQAGEDRRKVIIHGLIFTAGVLVSFWVISGLLFAAREAAGSSGDVTWGYQLQNPWVVLLLMLLMFVLALNMYGVFEIGTSATGIGGKLQSKQGIAGSFFSGVLATLVATPCSAPFLGAGIGAAIGLPAVPFFASFTAMALGLSLPYLVLSVFPQLIDKLPRPGPWMESFKQAMSFLLFATAGFLLWVYVGLEQIGLPGMLDVVIGLSAVAVAAWVYGRWNTPVRSSRTRVIALLLTALFTIGGLYAMLPKEKDLKWGTWSQNRVDELLADDKPVFIDFTASWCLTCQLNKKRAYDAEVAAMMKDKGIVALKADNTNRDPEINRAIRALGRAAVPVNVLLVPGKEPIITPELLSPGYLLELFGENVP
jgi:DsbC/DsbD-like thiol-disulfide interchange protein/cytochrome c biogenesis protein CcdA